jgi:hypothetical protein
MDIDSTAHDRSDCTGAARAGRRGVTSPDDLCINEKWAVVRVGLVPVSFPNIKARRKAIFLHDLIPAAAALVTSPWWLAAGAYK